MCAGFSFDTKQNKTTTTKTEKHPDLMAHIGLICIKLFNVINVT